MPNSISYYCVGFTWHGHEPENQLSRFLKEGIWESGYEDKYLNRVKSVTIGSRIAAKTTYTRKSSGKIISILKIHAVGTVTRNPGDGQTLKVRWDKSFKPFELENRGAYRSTISRINNADTIRAIFGVEILKEGEIPFYNRDKIKREGFLYPCFVLYKDPWDDFNYKTQYRVEYMQEEGVSLNIGLAKFLDSASDSGELPESFVGLDEDYCSLGQSNSFYSNLRKLDPKVAAYYVDAVNDIAINKGLETWQYSEGYTTSLIRSSEAKKALSEGSRVFHGISADNTFKFTFSTLIGSAEEEQSIEFDFSKKEELPFRIKVLIGKNGVGKTHYISKLASTLSGLEKEGNFTPQHIPPFSRVIAISYSLFDRFPRPKQSKTFSYYYCGFQGGKGLLTDNQINTRLKKSFDVLSSTGRSGLYAKHLSKILSEAVPNQIFDEDWIEVKPNGHIILEEEGISKFSSGQILIILVLAEMVAYITEESLLIIDELETHLHPNSISLFLNVINKILERFNSYAIIATHSSQVIQEVPAKDIIVLERFGDIPGSRKLDIETFGNNLDAITDRVFHATDHDEFYREFLSKLVKDFDYETVLRIFKDHSLPLPLNAKIYLQSLYAES